jgi:hypothetical protein
LPAFNIYEALKIDDPKKVEWKQTLIDLRGRELNGAMFEAAILNKADFAGAHLQGALLDKAQLQGASLDGAGLWRARLSNSLAKDLFVHAGSPDWNPKIFGGAWTNPDYAALRQSIEQAVPEGQNRDDALKRVAILDCAQQKWEQIALSSCNPAAEPPDTVKQWKKMIVTATVDHGAYAKALAVILGDLFCSNEADGIYVLRGLLRFDRFRKTGAEMPALATRITSPKCPVSTALTDADKTAIAVASKAAVASSIFP